MPIYEYRCGACGHEFDELQKLSDAPLKVCPKCGQPALAKQVTAAAFHLKGGGWYATDFKGGPKKDEKAKDDSASAATPAASDAKPAETNTTKAEPAKVEPAKAEHAKAEAAAAAATKPATKPDTATGK